MLDLRIVEELDKSAVPQAWLPSNFKLLTDPTEIETALNRTVWDRTPDGWLTLPCLGSSQFKAYDPRTDGKGKLVKYESPVDGGTGFSLPRHPDKPDYWQDVASNLDSPIAITEGYKKALSIMVQGLPAVNIHGVTAWAEPDTQMSQIREELLKVITGHPVVLFYDMDFSVKRNVWRSLCSFAAQLNKVCPSVSIAFWDTQFKGVDDFLASVKECDRQTRFNQLIQTAYPYEDLVKLKYKLDQELEREKSREHGRVSKTFGGLGVLPKFPELIEDSESVQEHFYHIFETLYPIQHAVKDVLWVYCEDSNLWYEGTKMVEKTVNLTAPLLYKYDPKTKAPRPAKLSNNAISEAIKYVQRRLTLHPALAHRKQPVANIDYWVFENGVYFHDTRTFKTFEDLKEIPFYTYRLPYEYDPTRIPSLFVDYIVSSFGAEKLEMIRAVVAWVLSPQAPYEYCVHIRGKSGSGKSTFLGVLQELLGILAVNRSSDLSDLASPDKRYQFLYGRRLFTVGDIQSKQKSLGDFCDLVTNSLTTFRALHSNEIISEKPNCRFVLSSPDPISVESSNAGWNRRIKVVSMLDTVVKLPIVNLGSKLSEELGAIAAWALAMEPDDRDRIMQGYREDAAQAEQRAINDPVAQFIEEMLVALPEDEGGSWEKMTEENITSTSTLYPVFEQWVKLNKSASLDYRAFVNDLKRILGSRYKPTGTHRISGKTVYAKEFIRNVKGSSVIVSKALRGEPALIRQISLEHLDVGGLASLGILT